MTSVSTHAKAALSTCSLAAAMAVCSTATWAALPASYSGVKLAFASDLADLNNLGQVAGVAFDRVTGMNQLAITGVNGQGMTVLDNSAANASNWSIQGFSDDGRIVGSHATPSGTSVGFYTGANGQGLTTLTGGTWANSQSAVVAISDQGNMVATNYSTPQAYSHQVSKDKGVTWQPLSFSAYSQVTAINDAGQLAMDTGKGINAAQASITDGKGANPRQLGILGYTTNQIGRNPGSRAVDINASGQVVGSSTWTGFPTDHAFITGPNGSGMRDLGTTKGPNDKSYEYAYAMALNDQGQVAGHIGQFGLGHAFVTDSNGVGMRDLNSLLSFTLGDGNHFSEALDINNSGQILARAQGGGLYLLTPSTLAPIPEPSTVAYMTLGLLGLAATIRRNKR